MPVYTAQNPLESLNTSNYQFSHLTYPLEFDDISSFGHYMNFYINVQSASNYLLDGSYAANPSNIQYTNQTQQEGYDFVWNKIMNPAFGSGFPGSYTTNPGVTLGGLSGNAAGNNIGNQSFNQIFQTRISEAISLYIPDSMSFTTQFDWQDASMTEMGGSLLKTGQQAGGAYQSAKDLFMGKVTEAAKGLGQVASDLILNPSGKGGIGDAIVGTAGFAVNPQIFVLFRGIDLRTFRFDFIFTPKTAAEAANVRNIIKAFRFHAAPEISQYMSRYYIAPSTFNVEFMYKGSINKNVFQMSTCVIQSISVDYAPYGWSTFNDGMPVQTIMSMVMKETEVITKNKVNQGL